MEFNLWEVAQEKEMKWTVETLHGEVRNSVDCRISQICEKVKDEFLYGISTFRGSTFQKSR
jgi:hypothetical protein